MAKTYSSTFQKERLATTCRREDSDAEERSAGELAVNRRSDTLGSQDAYGQAMLACMPAQIRITPIDFTLRVKARPFLATVQNPCYSTRLVGIQADRVGRTALAT